MSQESSSWLNQNVLIGYTDERGHAWHYRADDQGAEANHYPGAIPVEDVRRRLFDWEALEVPVSIPAIGASFDDGFSILPNRKAIIRSDSRAFLGWFKDSYQPHQYDEWLLKISADILGDDLQIGSAGLLKGGAQAWVSIEVPESIETPEGVTFRPHLLASTSFDGSLATGYRRCIQFVVCDNTFAAALGENGDTYKVRHSKYSGLKLQDAKDALGIIHQSADDFSALVAEWCAVDVTAGQFDEVLNELIPVPEDEGRGKTRSENKQAELRTLWNSDPRVTPWQGTKFGALQAFNTYYHHVATVKGSGGREAIRAERNMENTISGKTGERDGEVIAAIDKVLALA